MSLGRIRETVSRTVRELLSSGEKPLERRHFGGVPDATLSTLEHFDGIVGELERLIGVRRMLALTGMPGAGKTSAAQALAHRLFDPEGFSTAWIDADSRESLLLGLVSLGSPHRLNVSGVRPPSKAVGVNEKDVTRILEELARWGPWLLILDNMDGVFADDDRFHAVEPYLNALRDCKSGRVLITTRDIPADLVARNMAWHEMPLLDEEIGAKFLLERAGIVTNDRHVHDEAREIARQADGLPLALDQAAAYIHQEQRKRYSYTLKEYLVKYGEAAKAIREIAPRGKHSPSYQTFQVSFESLPEASRKVLLLCSLLDPEAIPLELLQECCDELRGGAGTSDLEVALRQAAALRLIAIEGSDVRLHREVHGVLGHLLESNSSKPNLVFAVQGAMDRLLAKMELASRLSPHLRMLLDGDAPAPVPNELSRLAQHRHGRELLKGIEAGETSAWEALLFGAGEASYGAMHKLEDRADQAELAHRLAALRGVCTPEYGRLIFVCVYLIIHYWWDSYLEHDHIADPVLNLWEETHSDAEDRRLLTSLRQFQDSYPAQRDYASRVSPAATSRWEQALEAVTDIQTQLGLDELPRLRTSSAARYARSILNIYLSECQRYASGSPRHQTPDNPRLDVLYSEAAELLLLNRDGFHRTWALWEWADYHSEAGERCSARTSNAGKGPRDYADAAREHFSRARELCFEGLRSALAEVDEADEDASLDAEVCARIYTLLAHVEAGLTQDPAKSLPYRCAALYTAYLFVLSEEDGYSKAFYEEHVDRTVDWLIDLSNSYPDALTTICDALRKWWGRPPLSVRVRDDLFDKTGPQLRKHLADLLLPTPPEFTSPKAGAPSELTDESRKELQSLAAVMPRRLPHLCRPNPECLREIAKALKAQLCDAGEEDTDGA